MSEETNTEWAEMDIASYRKNSNVEKKEEPDPIDIQMKKYGF